MSEAFIPVDPTPTDWRRPAMQQRIRRRYAAERRFRLLGLGAVLLSAGFLAFLLVTMVGTALGGFTPDRGPARRRLRRAVAVPRSGALQGSAREQALAEADFEARRCGARPTRNMAPARRRLFSKARWLRVRDAVADDPALLTRHATSVAARRDRRSTWPPRATATRGRRARSRAALADAGRRPHRPQLGPS